MPDYKIGKSILNAKNSLIQMAGLTLEEIVQIASSLESNERYNYGDLILKRSQIGKEGAKALAKALENNSPLNALHLLGNSPIGDEGAKFLAAALEKNSNLRELDVRGNKITDEGARAFITSLEKNKTLLILNLEHNQISPELMNSLEMLLKRNQELEKQNQELEKQKLNVLRDRDTKRRKALYTAAGGIVAGFVIGLLAAFVAWPIVLGVTLTLAVLAAGARLLSFRNSKKVAHRKEEAHQSEHPPKTISVAHKGLDKTPVIISRTDETPIVEPANKKSSSTANNKIGK